MSSFLENLVAMALGETPAGAARLSLPSRFAQPSAPMAMEMEDVSVKQEEPGPIPAEARGSAITPRLSAVEETVRPTSFHEPARADIAGSQPASPPIEPRRLPEALAPPRSPKVMPQPVAVPLSSEFAPQAPLAADTAMAAPQLRNQPSGAETAPNASFSPQMSPRTAIEDRTMPMSASAIADRPRANDGERPVIHVTIDRLEVRAPPPQKVASEQRRPRQQPTVSLADYLRGTGSGGQA